MTVIAWDGKILAADKQMTYGNVKRTSTKIKKIKNYYVAFSGIISVGMTMIEWFEDGENKENWPDCQKTEDFCNFIVVSKNDLYYYDKDPVKLRFENDFMAWGIGCEFAIGAMEMGADAIKAVEVAIKWCEGCGNGIDYFRIRK